MSQRLIPMTSGGRVPALEALLAVPAIRSVIREGKTHMVDNIIQTSGDVGMFTLDSSLAQLTRDGKITLETARAYANNPDDLTRLLKK